MASFDKLQSINCCYRQQKGSSCPLDYLSACVIKKKYPLSKPISIQWFCPTCDNSKKKTSGTIWTKKHFEWENILELKPG